MDPALQRVNALHNEYSSVNIRYPEYVSVMVGLVDRAAAQDLEGVPTAQDTHRFSAPRAAFTTAAAVHAQNKPYENAAAACETLEACDGKLQEMARDMGVATVADFNELGMAPSDSTLRFDEVRREIRGAARKFRQLLDGLKAQHEQPQHLPPADAQR